MRRDMPPLSPIAALHLVAGDGEAGPHVGVQLQLLAQRQVEAAKALADGRRHRRLQPDLVLLCLVREEVSQGIETPRRIEFRLAASAEADGAAALRSKHRMWLRLEPLACRRMDHLPRNWMQKPVWMSHQHGVQVFPCDEGVGARVDRV